MRQRDPRELERFMQKHFGINIVHVIGWRLSDKNNPFLVPDYMIDAVIPQEDAK